MWAIWKRRKPREPHSSHSHRLSKSTHVFPRPTIYAWIHSFYPGIQQNYICVYVWFDHLWPARHQAKCWGFKNDYVSHSLVGMTGKYIINQLYMCHERRSGGLTRIGRTGREDQKRERGYLGRILKSQLSLHSWGRRRALSTLGRV